MDFIGLNYYTRDFVRGSFRKLFGKECTSRHHRLRKNFLDWYVYPQGLYRLLLDLKRYELPVIVTENGTCETRDSFYEAYLREHIASVGKAIEAGVKVEGYFWWSLIDNFEWDKGFAPKFGLIEVDREQNRKVRDFAYAYRDICANNRIDVF